MGILTKEQANFILSSRLKKQTPNVVKDYSKDDGYEAFKELRWGWTGGKPMCPHCFHERLYEFRDRDKFKCAKCGKQFSTTTATAFKSRKMEHKSYIHAMSYKIHQPMPLMELGEMLGVNYRTAWRLNKILGLIKGNVSIKTQDMKWPYLKPSPSADGADIVALVNERVGRGMPEEIRADVCQEIILGVLEGTITLGDIAKQANQYIRKFYGKFSPKFQDISIDQPMRDGRSWHDVLEDRHARMDGEYSSELLDFEPLDREEFGYSDEEERMAWNTRDKHYHRKVSGYDRFEVAEKNRGLVVNPVLNYGRIGR